MGGGGGGVAYVLKADHGLDLPRGLQIEFSRRVQEIAERTGKELTGAVLWSLFEEAYLCGEGLALVDYSLFPEPGAPEQRRIAATLSNDGAERQVEGVGNGPIAAFVDALSQGCGIALTVADYREHALGGGADARATAYVQVRNGGEAGWWGVGIDANIITASLKAVASAAARTRRGAPPAG